MSEWDGMRKIFFVDRYKMWILKVFSKHAWERQRGEKKTIFN